MSKIIEARKRKVWLRRNVYPYLIAFTTALLWLVAGLAIGIVGYLGLIGAR